MTCGVIWVAIWGGDLWCAEEISRVQMNYVKTNVATAGISLCIAIY